MFCFVLKLSNFSEKFMQDKVMVGFVLCETWVLEREIEFVQSKNWALDPLKWIFQKNGYLTAFINMCFKMFLNSLPIAKPM